MLLSEAGQAGVLANLLGQGAPYLQRALRDLTEGDDRIRFVTVLGRVLGRFARRSAWGLASRVQHPQLVHQRVPFRGHIYVFVYSLLFSVSVSQSFSVSLYSRLMIIKCTKAHDTLAESGFDIKLCQSAGRSLRGDRPARATTVLYLIYELAGWLAGGFLVQLPRIGTIVVWVLLTTAVCLLRLSRLPLLSMTRIRQSNVCVRYYWSDR